jgi:carboxyl-terminal processing protease
MAKKNLRWIILPLIVAASLFFFLEKDFLPGAAPQSQPSESIRLLELVTRLVQQDYVEEPDPNKTMSGAFKGLVGSLDVLSSYLDETGVQRYQERGRTGQYETGLILYKRYGTFPLVIGIMENSPAADSGLELGSPIYALDGISTLGFSMLEANLYQKAPVADPVSIKTTQDNKNITLEIARSQLNDGPFTYSEEPSLGGVLRVHLFQAPLVDRLKAELIPRLKQTSQTLVLDLRNCHDGTLEEALAFTNLFLQKNRIGDLEKREGLRESLSCSEEPELPDLPLVIWTNQATMGPAELAAIVLNRNRNARIIGHQTLGLVARGRFFPLDDGTGLVLTSGVFRPAGGGELWEKGISPDIKLETDEQGYTAYLEQTRKLIDSR